MKVFKISVRTEQDKKVVGFEGFLLKRNDGDTTIEGYAECLYPGYHNRFRYLKGVLTEQGSLVFMQMSNNVNVSPICYCFPSLNNQGFWSGYHMRHGFFPVYPGMACANGRAMVVVQEMTGKMMNQIVEKTNYIFSEHCKKATQINKRLMRDYKLLADFLDENILLQISLHCGKW